MATPAVEAYPTLSPDGSWLAYSSVLSERSEVYVQPYPGLEERVTISTDGGHSPSWRGDGRELYYVRPRSDGANTMMAVDVGFDGRRFVPGEPRELFDAPFGTPSPSRGYDVTADGKRFLVVQNDEPTPEPPGQLVLVTNWFEELRRRVP